MPIAKVDARSFNYARQADGFLKPTLMKPSSVSSSSSLDNTDAVVTIESESQLWKDLTTSQDSVSSYIICLMAKLISLDSGQSSRPLPDVYKEITEMHVDITKYRQWSSKEKPLPAAVKMKALSLQHAIVATIHFLKQFYGFSPSLQLRNMYLRWNLARNYTIDGSAIADAFEVKVMTSFSVAASKDVIRDPLPLSPCSSSFFSSEEEEKLVHELISDCYNHHHRSFFGTLPPDVCKLLNSASVAASLSYIRLRDLVLRNPSLLSVAINHICFLLQTEISHTQEYGEREPLLPLVLLLKEFLTIALDVDYTKVYQTLMPFYMWRSSHAESIKKILNIVQLEKKVKGSTYRHKLLTEHDLGLKLKHYSPKTHSIILLVDTSHSESLGQYLYQSFSYHQEKPSSSHIKKLILRSVLYSAPSDVEIDLTDLDNKISRLSDGQLTQLCEEGVDITELAASFETIVEADQFLITEISKLSQTIAKASDEQRDSAFSSTSDDHCSPSFPLPSPYMPVHQLENVNFISMVGKMKEVLQRIQTNPDQPYLPSTVPHSHSESFVTSYPLVSSGHPDLSQTSLDSTGSGAMETNGRDHRNSFERTSINEHWSNGHGGGYRPLSPAAKSDPGVSTLLVLPVTGGERPTSDTDGFASQESDHDAISDTSSRTSEEVTSRYSIDSSKGSRLERRHTETFASIPTSLSYRRSTLTKPPMGSYSNQAASPVSGTGSIKVKQRANPSNSIRLKNRRIQPITAALVSHNSTKLRVLKFVIAGDDEMISNTAKAFTYLRTKEPNLFWNLETHFHYIPLSQASSSYSGVNGALSGPSALDPPEPVNEKKCYELGGDVLIGRYISHMDSWFEKNVMLSVYNVLRLLPNDSLAATRPLSSMESLDTRWSVPPTPSKILIDVTSNYIREACHSVQIKMFKVKMTLRSEKSDKGFEHKEVFMVRKLDVQRLAGKKAQQRQAKLYETSLALTELSLDNSFIRGELIQHKDVWLISGSNIPHSNDPSVSNPENECLELTVTKCQAEGGRISQTKYRTSEEVQYHVYELLIEAKDKPLSVIIDGDVADITDNVIRIEVAPAYIDQGIADTSLRRTERFERQMNFPIMTFWQVDV